MSSPRDVSRPAPVNGEVDSSKGTKSLAILGPTAKPPDAPNEDPMQLTTTTPPRAPPSSMGPPALNSPDVDPGAANPMASVSVTEPTHPGSNASNVGLGAAAAAAAAQQPKVVQTAFIHKLYKYAQFV